MFLRKVKKLGILFQKVFSPLTVPRPYATMHKLKNKIFYKNVGIFRELKGIYNGKIKKENGPMQKIFSKI